MAVGDNNIDRCPQCRADQRLCTVETVTDSKGAILGFFVRCGSCALCGPIATGDGPKDRTEAINSWNSAPRYLMTK